MSRKHHTSAAFVILFLGCVCVAIAFASPYCCGAESAKTVMAELAEADMVLLGTFANPQFGAGGFGEGTTDLVIEHTLKAHDFAKGKKVITLPRYVPPNKSKFVVFC